MGTAEKLLKGLDDNSDLQGLSLDDKMRAIMYPALAQEVYGGSVRGRLGGRGLTAIFERRHEVSDAEEDDGLFGKDFGIRPVYPLGLPVSGTLKFGVNPHQSDIGKEVVRVWNGKKTEGLYEAYFALALRTPSGKYYRSRNVVEDWSRLAPDQLGNIFV
ncbi:hypothetical protein HYU12_05470, partial [Candidatus Woesearchaeota archaeon]|nr:hypothetical protein [Candidatus Woesearchaeota archaeon]